MKTGNYYLSLAVVIGFLCVPVLGEVEPAMPDGTLLGQPNPALAGIEVVFVTINPPSTDPNKYSSWIHKLDWKLKERLQKNNLVVNPSIGGNFWNSSILRVDLHLLNLQASQQWVFLVQTSSERTVTLPKQQDIYMTVGVWETQPVMKVVSEENMQAAVTDAVLEQVEEFIHAYLAANPPDKQVPDENDIGIILKEQFKPAVKSTPASQQGETAEYKYVASKNSNVFHRPDCSSAKRIKPENLVGYRSRDEAINAGKRPCKRCKP